MTDNHRALLSWIEDQIEFHTEADGEDDVLTKDWKKLHKKLSKPSADWHVQEDFAAVYTLMQNVQRFDDNGAALRLVGLLGLGIEWDFPHVTVNFISGDDVEPCSQQMDDCPDDLREEEMRALRAVIHEAADHWMLRFSGILKI